MKKNKIFVACDSTNISKIKKEIKEKTNSKIKFGYKFGLEFLNSKIQTASKLKNKTIFADLNFKIFQIHVLAIKTIKDLKVNYLTIHISSGLKA